MLRWWRRFALKMRTIAVVELNYGRKLDAGDGADMLLLNMTTQQYADLGLNEYDAAAGLVLNDAILTFQDGGDCEIGLLNLHTITAGLMHRMKRPDLAEHILGQVREVASQ